MLRDVSLVVSLVALALGVAALVVALVALRRVSVAGGRVESLTRGSAGGSLEAILDDHLRRVETFAAEVQAATQRTQALEQEARKAVQRVGLVRFNPFEDTGSNQSFALALLDADEDGVVLSSLHSRQATRLYAKPIAGGRSDAALSAEETEALRLARSQQREDRRRV